MSAYPSIRNRRGDGGGDTAATGVAGSGMVGQAGTSHSGVHDRNYRPDRSMVIRLIRSRMATKNHRLPVRAGGGSRGWPSMSGLLNASDVHRVEAFCTRLDLELDFLTFDERLEPIHHDRREMDEHILAAILLNEAVPLRVIEPLHFPSGHAAASCGVNRARVDTHGANRPRFAATYIDAPCKFVNRTLCPATTYRIGPINNPSETYGAYMAANVTYITVLRHF